MSESNSRTTAQSNGESAASHTRRQTRIRSREEEGTEEHRAQPSAHVSPAMRIYRHALESIFAMLELADLSRALAVNREWAAAVRSMKPINASIERDNRGWFDTRTDFRPLPPIARIVASSLLRHLAAIHIGYENASWTPLSNASIGLLSQYAPTLTSLWCKLILTNDPLIFPPGCSR